MQPKAKNLLQKGNASKKENVYCFLLKTAAQILQKKEKGWVYSMPHFLVTLTMRKITKATITKVMTATKKLPKPNI